MSLLIQPLIKQSDALSKTRVHDIMAQITLIAEEVERAIASGIYKTTFLLKNACLLKSFIEGAFPGFHVEVFRTRDGDRVVFLDWSGVRTREKEEEDEDDATVRAFDDAAEAASANSISCALPAPSASSRSQSLQKRLADILARFPNLGARVEHRENAVIAHLAPRQTVQSVQMPDLNDLPALVAKALAWEASQRGTRLPIEVQMKIPSPEPINQNDFFRELSLAFCREVQKKTRISDFELRTTTTPGVCELVCKLIER